MPSLNFRFQYATGSQVGYSIERLSDGFFYDFTSQTFKSSGWTTQVKSLTEDTGNFLGRWKDTLTTTAIQFTDGYYCISVHNTGASNVVIGELVTQMINGGDAPAPMLTGDTYALLNPMISGGVWTGASLANCLESVPIAEPTVAADGPMNTWSYRKLLRWFIMRFARVSKTPSLLTVQKIDGTTSTSQAVFDDHAGNESTGTPG